MNNFSIPSTHAERKITNFSVKHSFTLYPSLSPYSQTESLTEEQIHSLHVGWRNFFPVVVLCQFLVLAENRFWFYILMYLEYKYSCGVVLVFWFWRETLFGVTYVFNVQYSCAVMSVFWLWREIDLKMRTRFYKKKSYWVTLLWFASQCVYFIRPTTLLLCIFLFCIFLLYHTDSQVEVQMRILFKEKYRKLCQRCKYQQSHFDFLNNAYWVSFFKRNNLPAKKCFS